MAMQRIEYAGSVHDEEEVQAVLSVLRGGATALRIGPHTKEMERLVALAFGKQRGVMVNSGSSALYLAVELLALAPGDEILTPALTFSTDIASIVRAGLVPVLLDVTPEHLSSRRRSHRGGDRPAHEGDAGAEPDRQLPGLGRAARRSPTAMGCRSSRIPATASAPPCAARRPARARTSRSRASRSRTSSPRRAPAAWSSSTTWRWSTAR